MKDETGIKYDCPDCGKWWIAEDDSQEESACGNTYCPYCDDYTKMKKSSVTLIKVKE